MSILDFLEVHPSCDPHRQQPGRMIETGITTVLLYHRGSAFTGE